MQLSRIFGFYEMLQYCFIGDECTYSNSLKTKARTNNRSVLQQIGTVAVYSFPLDGVVGKQPIPGVQ